MSVASHRKILYFSISVLIFILGLGNLTGRKVDSNSKLCFAPIGQACCEESELPDGSTGCMFYMGQSPDRADVSAFKEGNCPRSFSETQYQKLKTQ